MVTGDHPLTAEAIARQVNIIKEGSKTSKIINDSDKLNEEGSMDIADKDQSVILKYHYCFFLITFYRYFKLIPKKKKNDE